MRVKAFIFFSVEQFANLDAFLVQYRESYNPSMRNPRFDSKSGVALKCHPAREYCVNLNLAP